MLKFTIFLFILSHFILYTNYSPTAIILNNQTQTSPTPKQIAKIKLSKNSLKVPCSLENPLVDKESCDENMSIDVSAFLENTNDLLSYEYDVTGGRIIGQGKNVLWDLKDVNFGAYEIFARLKDNQNRILDVSETKTITVEDCGCGAECFCSSFFEITSPDIKDTDSKVKRGDKMVFIVTGGETSEDTVFNWQVKGGEIIYEGHEKSLIRVIITSNKTEKELKVSVKVNNYDYCLMCSSEASKTFKIADEPKN